MINFHQLLKINQISYRYLLQKSFSENKFYTTQIWYKSCYSNKKNSEEEEIMKKPLFVKRLSKIKKKLIIYSAMALIFIVIMSVSSFGQENVGDTESGVDTVWVLIAAFLVFFMQAGFGMLEAGFTRAKNASNILMKNTMDFAMGSIAYFLIGYALMFGDGNPLFGTEGFAIAGFPDWVAGSNLPRTAHWIFQAVFCAAAATIVAGAMAERTKFIAYIIYSFFISAIIYPVVGHWVWGPDGWLASLGFADFAGSTVVHSVGGWASLAGTIVMGPRIGKFNPDGSVNAIPGHNLPLASLGMFILWFGWFGFNPGSQIAAFGTENAEAIANIAVNTNLSAAAGAITAMIIMWVGFKKPDFGMTINGALAGLVAVTAPCAYVSAVESIIIGVIAGIVVVIGVNLLDKVKVDDPVGAIPVHGMCGALGTLFVGLFGQNVSTVIVNGQEKVLHGLFHNGGFHLLGVQLLGMVAVFGFVFVGAFILFTIIKKTIGLRVSKEEEIRGLDYSEHGSESYTGFRMDHSK